MGELVFFDVETTMPTGPEGRCWMLEFGAILVCPKRLVEIGSYSTLIRPVDLSVVSTHRLSGITREAVSSAPPFEDVADLIYKIMHGRVWVGHNIRRFDCPRLKEVFADIGRPAPEPIGTIDSLSALQQGFGRRAGDLKMATLASYFKIGQQKHRSIDDARMNLEVIKHCATVLFLESSLPNILSNDNTGMVTRSKADVTLTCREEISPISPPISTSVNQRTSSTCRQEISPISPPTATTVNQRTSSTCTEEISAISPPTCTAVNQRTSSTCRREIRRKSPPTCTAVNHRTSPYNTRSLGKVVEKARYALRSARGSSGPLNTLLRHSRYLLR